MLDPTQPYGFDVERTVPHVRWLREKQRTLDPRLLDALLHATVAALQHEIPGLGVGIANFITTSDGQYYGTFHGKLRERQKRDRQKRRRKAKLRKCLEKKGVKKLPSTSSKSGQRLARHVRQSINRAVNQCFARHEGAQFAYEQASENGWP